jgi:hypothetical protein
MWYLRLEELRTKRPSIGREEIAHLVSMYDFLEYSAVNWAVHFRAAMIAEDHALIALGLELCDVQADRYMSWELVFWQKAEGRSPRPGLHNLYLASCLGLKWVVGRLLAAPGIDVNAADEGGLTPFWWASAHRHMGVVGQLLATPGVDVNPANKRQFWTLGSLLAAANKVEKQ